MQKKYKKIFTASILSVLFLNMAYLVLEPTMVVAATTNDSIVVTLNVTSGVSITAPTDVTMAPNISMSANKSIGSVAWTVSTNSATGYTLAVKNSTATAMMGVSNGDSFANYTEAVANTPDLWAGVAVGTKEFGFSAYGTNVPTATWGTATAGCGVAGVADVTLKYRGFLPAMSDIQVASVAVPTPVAGTATNVCFAAEQNGVYAESGAYTATITATATAA
jgi:hypothetical protein